MKVGAIKGSDNIGTESYSAGRRLLAIICTVYLHGHFFIVMQAFCKFLQEGVMLRKIVQLPEPCKEQSRTGSHSAVTYKNILEHSISYVVTLV